MDELAALRKQRKELQAALAADGRTFGGFAAMLGVTRQHLRLVFIGERASPRIRHAVAAYIAAFKSTQSAA